MPLETKIPFDGFYESKWSGLMDNAVEMFVYNENERQESHYYKDDGYIADERLRVDSGEFAWEFLNYADAYQEIAFDYAESFGMKLDEWSKEIDLNAPACGIKFKLMTSPRFYNFETDRIFTEISEDFVNWMFKVSEAGVHANLRKVIKERFTSRDGFISGYDNTLDEWLEKPLTDWDHNEIETLMLAVFYDYFTDDRRDWDWEIYEVFAEHDYEYFDKHFNYEKWEAKVNELRAEIEESIRETEGEPEIKLAPCPETPDLFQKV